MKTSCSYKIRNFILAAVAGVGLGVVFPALANTDTAVIVNPDGKLIYLDTLGGEGTYASDINESGQVAGTSDTVAGDGWMTHAFITGPNGMGMTDFIGTESVATGINNAGQVAGYVGIVGGHAFITGSNGIGVTDLSALEWALNRASGINNAGQVVGEYTIDYQSFRAFMTGPNGEGLTDLGTLGETGTYANSSANDINDAGQVVGSSNGHAFITGPNGGGMTGLDTPSGFNTSADAINTSGQVVGSYGLIPGGSLVAFITGPDGDGMTDLGNLGGTRTFANDINDAGQVVGWSETAGGDLYPERAFITGPNGMGMTDLNSLVDLPDGAYLSSASASLSKSLNHFV